MKRVDWRIVQGEGELGKDSMAQWIKTLGLHSEVMKINALKSTVRLDAHI